MSDQSIDTSVGSDIDEVLIQFAPDNAEHPLSGRVEKGSERNTDTDEDEIGERQTQYHCVGGGAQALVTGDGRHDGQVPDEAEDGDDAEDGGNDSTENPADAAVRRARADVGREGVIADTG